MLSFLMLLATPLLAATTVHTDFEGGSLGRIEKVSDARFRLGAKGEKDQDGRNRQANWYYFRIDGAPKRELILDIVDLPGEYNYKPNRGAITKDTPPVISYDQRTWKHVDTFDAYARYLETHPDEHVALFNAILINVTAFFRDDAAWEYLAQHVIPDLLSRKPAPAPIRVWSAGCASGGSPLLLPCGPFSRRCRKDRKLPSQHHEGDRRLGR